jgi:hypothetical protein
MNPDEIQPRLLAISAHQTMSSSPAEAAWRAGQMKVGLSIWSSVPMAAKVARIRKMTRKIWRLYGTPNKKKLPVLWVCAV